MMNRMRARALVAAAGMLSVTTALTGCGGQWLWEVEQAASRDLSQVNYLPVPDDERAKSIIEGIEPNEELRAKVPEEYRANGVKWTTSVGYPPMELFTDNGKDIIGVDPAIAQALMRKLGLEMSIEDQEFNAQIPGILAGRFDAVISSMTDNEERRQSMTFVDYVQSGNAFLVAEGNPLGVQSPMDLCGKTLAVVDAGSSAALVDEMSQECVDAGKPAYEVLRFDGDQSVNLALKSGRADATVTDYPVAQWHASNPENKLDSVAIEGDESIWGIGVGNDDEEFAKVLQEALQELIDDGTYAKILAAWEVDEMAIETATINGGNN
ncbi:ABC transporter substrate-binding protein [uncultured Gulosibacter sp.]|uniref:ABC transporter substrate-binding protein n=1 Tax=uncultured Gulosibacter sp. TaxID=1339167 RepID=UPI00288BB9D1|nr:ABC transporter substrate-binding protein [uncultured Gulosibacter sp.]